MEVSLRPYHPGLLDTILQWRGEPSSVRNNPLADFSREDLARGLLEEGHDFSQLKSSPKHRWVIHWGNEPVGTISLRDISHSMGYGEIGYQVCEARQGKGIATAAVNLFASQVFTQSKLRRLTALVHDKNISSCRVLEKCGFVREGLLREHFILEGRPANEIYYGLLKKDWEKR